VELPKQQEEEGPKGTGNAQNVENGFIMATAPEIKQKRNSNTLN
jgi:hypothetical protein